MVSYLGSGVTLPIVRAGDVTAAGVAFPLVGSIFIVLRAFSHRLKDTSAGLADAFGILSWAMITAVGAIFVWSSKGGAMGHATPENVPQWTDTDISAFQRHILESVYFSCIFLVLALGTTKLSVLFFFRQLFINCRRTLWDYITGTLVVLVSLWTLAFFLTFVLTCGGTPSAFWSARSTYNRYCLPMAGSGGHFSKACFISDLVLDIICLALPFPIIWSLNLSIGHKLSITGIFLIGLMTSAAGVAWFVIWIQVIDQETDVNVDNNLAVAMILQWGMIEAGLAFVASQLPALGPYLTKAARRDIRNSLRNMLRKT